MRCCYFRPAVSNLQQGSTLACALKVLQTSAAPSLFPERNMLRTLATQNHPHIIDLLATYRWKEKYHFIVPYADMILRNYWRKKSPRWNSEFMMWHLHQLRALHRVWWPSIIQASIM